MIQTVQVTVQYKKDVRLFCGEKEALNEELQNINDINQIVDEIDPRHDDHRWKGVKFYRRWTLAPTNQQTSSDNPTNQVEIVSDLNNDKYSFTKDILTIKSLS